MDSASPTIGITLSSRADAEANARAATALYVTAVESQGAQVALLKAGGAPADIGLLDGLLLTGGGDVDPCWYWESPHSLLGRVEHDRDVMEIALTRAATGLSLPVLGICRGAQVLGVALGGTLHQDIGACLRGARAHSTAGDQAVSHRVRLASRCRLREILGQSEVVTNSYHHQANAQLGPGARATAWSDDDVIEAIEGAGDGFLVGVQWHPERMVGEDAAQVRLFAAFVEAARAFRLRRGETGGR